MTRNQRYYRYINSPEWQVLRQQVISERGRRCQCCSISTFAVIHVHHIRYRNLTDCIPSDFLVLCEDCHNDLHKVFKIKGIKHECELEQVKSLVSWFRTTPPGQIRHERHQAKIARRKVRAESRKQVSGLRKALKEVKLLIGTRRCCTPGRIDAAIEALLKIKADLIAGKSASLPTPATN